MKSITWISLFALAWLGLAGCATMSEDECLLSDWRAIGFEDGARGYSAARLGDHRKACAKHGVVPDFDAYQEGHDQGLRDYCQPARGFQLGSSGGQYQGMCAADLEPAFVDAWHNGQHLYLLRSNVNGADNAISNHQQALANTKERIRDTEARLIAQDTTPEDRVLLLADLKELSEDVGQIEAEIADLSEDRVRYRQDLDAYENVLANTGYY